MKYILYFHFYAFSYGDTMCYPPITTIMTIQKDSIMFYVYDLGYVKWKIDDIIREQVLYPDYRYSHGFNHRSSEIQAIYRISYKDITGFITMFKKVIEIRIITDNKPEIIQLRRKSKFKLKHKKYEKNH